MLMQVRHAKEAPPANIAENESNDIPELINDTNADLKQLDAESIATDASSEFDIESTQTQKRPAMFATDDAADSEDDEPDFDLDQALSPETDSTNLMPGLTPNLDQLAAQARMQDLKDKNPVQGSKVTTFHVRQLKTSLRSPTQCELMSRSRLSAPKKPLTYKL